MSDIKKVLIVGGGLFVGKAIANELAKYYNVYVLNRGNNEVPNTRQIVCDCDDAKTMALLLRNMEFDCVVDVSGLNEQQVRNVCDNVKGIKKFIFISSSAVYELKSSPFYEEDNKGINPYWKDYGINKIAAEDYLINQYKNTDTELVLLRPPYIYGENNYVEREAFIFDHLVNNKRILIPRSNNVLQFLYAPDLGRLVNLFIMRKNDNINIYNVGNKKPYLMTDWVKQIGQAIGIEPKISLIDYKGNVRDFFPFHPYDNYLDVSKLSSLWFIETPFDVGIRNAFAWYKQTHVSCCKDVIENEKRISGIVYETKRTSFRKLKYDDMSILMEYSLKEEIISEFTVSNEDSLKEDFEFFIGNYEQGFFPLVYAVINEQGKLIGFVYLLKSENGISYKMWISVSYPNYLDEINEGLNEYILLLEKKE